MLTDDSWKLLSKIMHLTGRIYNKPEQQLIKSRRGQHVIPRKGNSKQGNKDIDWCLYRYRHLVENAFLKIKKYRAVATRYENSALTPLLR